MEVHKKSSKEMTKADIVNLSLKIVSRLYLTEMANATETLRELSKENKPWPETALKKAMTDMASADKELNRQMDAARKSGIKLPAWAYPQYVIDANPDVFPKPKKKNLAATPRKIK